MTKTTAKNSFIRLQVALARSGLASRRGAIPLIESGKVSVNGKVVLEKGYRVDPAADKIRVASASHIQVGPAVRFYYYLFNKPLGVTTTLQDPHAAQTLKEYVKQLPGRLYPAGRLDRDSTGLLLLTNDGNLVFRLSHPRFGVTKGYEVRVSGMLPETVRKTLERGIELHDGKTSPCKVVPVRPDRKNKTYTDLRFLLHEGRKRQIRRMCQAVGYPVLTLHRSSYGPLLLGPLPPGKFRELTATELESLHRVTGIDNKSVQR